jgi:hypothetical protein
MCSWVIASASTPALARSQSIRSQRGAFANIRNDRANQNPLVPIAAGSGGLVIRFSPGSSAPTDSGGQEHALRGLGNQILPALFRFSAYRQMVSPTIIVFSPSGVRSGCGVARTPPVLDLQGLPTNAPQVGHPTVQTAFRVRPSAFIPPSWCKERQIRWPILLTLCLPRPFGQASYNV